MQLRLAALERQANEAASLGSEEQNLPSPERHAWRAWARASQAERNAIERYLEKGNESAYLKLWEEIIYREAPTLAADVRCQRDALLVKLEALEEAWREEGRHRSTSYSDQAFWNLSNARVNRMHVLQLNKAEVIEDESEVMRIVGTVTEPETTVEDIWRLVGRI